MINKKEYINLTKHELNIQFNMACFNGNLELVQYLLTTKDFKKHANIHAQDDYGFQIACNSEYLDIISFLIFDQKLKKTQNIKKYLKENPNQEVLNMFKIRDLNEKINSELSSNNIINKKVKL